MSINRGMDKEDMVNIHNGLLLSHDKEWNLAICKNMDGTRGHHVKWNLSDKDKYFHVDSMWNLKNKKQNKWTNIPKYK